MSKKLLFAALLLVILLLLNASAASIRAEKGSYSKGEEVVFRGGLLPGEADTAVAKSGEKIVFREPVRGKDDGSFAFTYKSSFLDPSGEWAVSLQDSNVSTKVRVNAVPDSAVLVITFSSPIPGEYKRTEDIEISLKITHLGELLDSAEAAVWGADGKKLPLERKDRGMYGLAYALPYNALVGDWEFFAVAQKDVNGEVLGGENKIHLSVARAPIAIDVIEPVLPAVEIEQAIPIVVKPLYFNGKAPANPGLAGRIGDVNLSFSQGGGGTFSAEYPTTEGDAGELVIALFAFDDAGNSGEEKVNIVVGGWLNWFVKKNWPYFVAGTAVLLFVLLKSRSKIRKSVGLTKLKRQRSVEFAKLKKLQRDYFEVQAIDRKTFEQKSAEFESSMARLDERIRVLEGKKRVIK